MAVTQTLSEGLKREFEVIITKNEIDKSVDQKLETLAKKANLPGFRPGKVPVSVVKNRFGKQVLDEVLRESVDTATKDTMEKNKLTPSSQPKIEIVSFEEGKDLKAKLLVEIMPDFEIPDLSTLDITKPIVKMTEKDINAAVERIANENTDTREIKNDRTAKKGDTLVIDFVGKVDGKPFEGGEAKGHNLKLGSNTFIPGFEDALIGSSKGETRKVKVTFPKDYQAKNLAGRDAVFQTKVNSIREDVEVKIDDDFAKKLGLNDLEALKKAVSEQISKQHQQQSRDKSKRQILDKLADLVSFDLPETLEKEEYINICKAMNPNSKPDTDKSEEKNPEPDKGMSKEEKLDASEIAKRRVRLGLLLSEIGRKNNIKVEEEDTRNAMMREIQKYPGQEKQIMDYLKSNPEAQQQLSGPIFEDKIIDFILELANIKEKVVSVDELYKEDEMDLKKEATKAKKSNKVVDKNKIKKPTKKVSKKS